MKIEYAIVQTTDPIKLVNIVNGETLKGWKPYGDLIVLNTIFQLLYIQSLVRETE